MDALLLIVLPLCLATSFLCAGMEAGIFTLGRWRIAQQMREGQARAARLYAYLQDTENFLWTVFIGNTLALFGAVWIIAVALIHLFPANGLPFWGAFAASAFLFYAFCDLFPKTLFRKFPNRLCLVMSAPFRLLHLLLSPLVQLMEGITRLLLRWSGGRIYKGQTFRNRNELRLLMEDTAQSLTTEERGMISRVFELHNISVRQITVPFSRIPNLGAHDSIEEAFRVFRSSAHNVLPVWSSGPRHKKIAGFFDLKKVLFQQRASSDRVENHLSRPLFLEEDMRVHEALRRLQRSGQRIAVVTARDGREIGLAPIEEILKVIFGEVSL